MLNGQKINEKRKCDDCGKVGEHYIGYTKGMKAYFVYFYNDKYYCVKCAKRKMII